MTYNLYSVQADGSKVLLSSYGDLVSAQAAETDSTLTYSIEAWNGLDTATVIS